MHGNITGKLPVYPYLKLVKMSCFSSFFFLLSFVFYKIRKQEGRTGPVGTGRVVSSGSGEEEGKRGKRMNIVQC
jgi:hypothetical protein